MDYFLSMDDFDPSQGLVEDVECLFNGEDFIAEFALNGVKIAQIAVLHDEKVPIAVYVMPSVPSKVL
jgi:hypothetical protein